MKVPPKARLVALLALCAAAFLALPGGAAAKPRGCAGLHLGVARHLVQSGGSVRIRGRVCHRHRAGGYVRLQVHGPHGRTRAVRVRIRRSGKFTRKVKLFPARVVTTVHFRARHRAQRSNPVAVKLAPAPSSSSESRSSAGAPTTARSSGCGLSGEPGEAVEMTEPGCPVVASDTAAEASPLSFWSSIGCVSASRYSYGTSGGDTHLTAAGSPQGNEAFRRLTVLDGDELYGSRCELGENNHFTGRTTFYHQGEHLVTYMSIRLPANYPLGSPLWQTVMQMKQAQPSNAGGGAPILEMEARLGRWIVVDDWHELFSFPARAGVWTRFAWNVYYSDDPNEGWVQVSADLNGDGDFDDPGERSPVFHTATLKTETAGPETGSDGIAPGEAIPSHLRMGVYHDPGIPCPPPEGCSVELDNVQVLRG